MRTIALTAVWAVVASAAGAGTWDPANFTAEGMKWAPVPSGHVVGKDNAPGLGLHHSGEDCAICHKTGGSAGNLVWTITGTIYEDRAARVPLPGAEVILQDYEGQVVSVTTNAAGNFWTAASLASHPYTVGSYHGGPPFTPLFELYPDGTLRTPAPPADARTWKYKTWVKKGSSVVPMVNIAGVGGSVETQRMSCNMHHGGIAHRAGGMWAGRANVLSSYPARHVSYRQHVFPILRDKCVPCHVPGRTRTSVGVRSDVTQYPNTLDYSGALDLTSYEGSTADGVTKKGLIDVLKAYDPEASLLLRKALKGATHAGGEIWQSTRDSEYRTIAQWIAEGAKEN